MAHVVCIDIFIFVEGAECCPLLHFISFTDKQLILVIQLWLGNSLGKRSFRIILLTPIGLLLFGFGFFPCC